MGRRWRGAMSLLQGELAGSTPNVSTFVMRRHNNARVSLDINNKIDRLILLWSFARVVYVASLLRKWLSNLPASSNLADSVWQKEFLLFYWFDSNKARLGLWG